MLDASFGPISINVNLTNTLSLPYLLSYVVPPVITAVPLVVTAVPPVVIAIPPVVRHHRIPPVVVSNENPLLRGLLPLCGVW
jgi:hypothetical protein